MMAEASHARIAGGCFLIEMKALGTRPTISWCICCDWLMFLGDNWGTSSPTVYQGLSNIVGGNKKLFRILRSYRIVVWFPTNPIQCSNCCLHSVVWYILFTRFWSFSLPQVVTLHYSCDFRCLDGFSFIQELHFHRRLKTHKSAIILLTADNKRIFFYGIKITSLITRLLLYADRSLFSALSTQITNGLIWDYSQIEVNGVISLAENEGNGKRE